MLWIKVEPTAGNGIEQVAGEMLELVKRLGSDIGIECDFNGIEVLATIDYTVEDIVKNYKKALKEGRETEYR